MGNDAVVCKREDSTCYLSKQAFKAVARLLSLPSVLIAVTLSLFGKNKSKSLSQ